MTTPHTARPYDAEHYDALAAGFYRNDRDFPDNTLTPSDWLANDPVRYDYRDAVRASRSDDPAELVRAVCCAAHSRWANRDTIINRAVANPAFPPAVAAFVLRYWGHAFTSYRYDWTVTR